MDDKLANPPLIEAICEFKFAPVADWDWTVAGRLYDQVQAEFSERSQVEALKVEMQQPPGGESATQIAQGLHAIQMRKRDGSAMVQVGSNLLVVNHLRPYPSWAQFRALVLDMLDKYVAIAGDSPLARIGLRYINRIPMKGPVTDLATIITTEPTLTGALDRALGGFYQRFELLHDDPAGTMILQIGILKSNTGDSMMIDLDFGSRHSDAPSTGEGIGSWLDAAHARIKEAFRSSLNPRCFNALKEGRPWP